MKKFYLLAIFLSVPISGIAATAVALKDKPVSYLNHHLPNKMNLMAESTPKLEEVSRIDDAMNNTHVRLGQTYHGYPVWNSQAIMHMPANTSKNMFYVISANDNRAYMTGTVYEGIDKDLSGVSVNLLKDENQSKAKGAFKNFYSKKYTLVNVQYQQESSKVIIYIDNNHRAHYGFLTSFYYDDKKTGPHRPTAIVDAETHEAVKVWDQILHFEPIPKNLKPVQAGGVGGNLTVGDYKYDNLKGHRPTLPMSLYLAPINLGDKKVVIPVCFLLSPTVVVYDVSYDRVASTVCPRLKILQGIHWLTSSNGLYWTEDSANGGRSPSLDAYYAALVVSKMYQEWYNIPVFQNKAGKARRLVLRTHYGREYVNAFWDGYANMMSFGDGDDTIFPLTTVDITAHEISHAFTQQHSNLSGASHQSASLNEAFSDMAAKAAEYYTDPDKKTDWTIGREVFKKKGEVIRYLDSPSKDGSSIGHMKKFKDDMRRDPHADAGIFNRAFFLIATSNGWNVRKAFDVMVQANRGYWTPETTFKEAACGVVSAAKDLKYDVASVQSAFQKVGLETKDC